MLEFANKFVDMAKTLSGEAAAEEAAKKALQQATENGETLAKTLAEAFQSTVTPDTVKQVVDAAKEVVQEQIAQQPSSPAETLQSLLNGLTGNANEVKEGVADLVKETLNTNKESVSGLVQETLAESDSSSWAGYILGGLGSAGAAVVGPVLWFAGAKKTKDMAKRVEESLTNKPLFELIKSSPAMVKIVDSMKDKEFALQALNGLNAEQTEALAKDGKLLDRLKGLAKASDKPAFQAKLLAYLAYNVIQMPRVDTDSDTESDEPDVDATDGVVPPVLEQPVVPPVEPQPAVNPAQAPVTDAEINDLVAKSNVLNRVDLEKKVKVALQHYFPAAEQQRAAFNVMQRQSDLLQNISGYDMGVLREYRFECNVINSIKNDAGFIEATKLANRNRPQ